MLNKSEVAEVKKQGRKTQREYNSAKDYIDLVKITPTNWSKIDDFKNKNKINNTPQENEALQKRLVGRGVPNE